MSSPLPSLLIVDDDPLIGDSLCFLLARDYAIDTAATRAQAIARVRNSPRPPALALIDLGLPPTPHRPDEGFALIADLLAHAPQMRIVVLSGQSDERNARHARTLGAMEFVAKPAHPDLLRALLARVSSFQDTLTSSEAGLIGHSPALQALRLRLKQFARSPFPVLIEGESGSGKELAARALHLYSERADRPYLALNCAAISPGLMEATLFGHSKGAFTGAGVARAGYFEDAADGALLLDEIGELPLELQPKLLRVLENGDYQRVGETQTRRSNARIVAATNRDLKKEVRAGRFRADLYHRLSVFTLTVPPLRELGDDRVLLLEHFNRL
ncbi:MAG TPA: sigma-54 dependent transcriptional regulator, partial [Rhodocyclaceae bacterium]|nr:sigma-54 dependent transcriptional regulator [Rhodocyclaceae bacterium]